MKQKLLFLLASLLLPLAASAYDACINGIYYNIVKKAKQATVTFGDSQSGTYSGKVVIPATVEYDGTTCNVIAIGEYAFRGCALTSLSIPASITTIEYDAFENASINQLRINDLAAWCNITFGKYDSKPIACSQKLFINGKETTNLVIPDGVTKINDYAFYGAQMLNTITIPGSVTEIGHYAFCCKNHIYAKVTIDNRSLTAIGNRAFKFPVNTDQRYIAELHITDLAKWCSNVFFYDKSHFEEYGNYKYEYNNPLEATEKFFVNGKEIKDLVIPDGATKISANSFYGAKMLESVSIPNSVKEIGKWAFAGCSSLEKAAIGDSVEVLHWVFNDCNKLKNLTIGRGIRKFITYGTLESLENIYISDLTAYCKIITKERSGSSRDPFTRIPKKQTPMKTSSDTRNARLFLNGKEVKDLVVPIDIFDTTDDMVEFSDHIYYICDAFYGISSLTSVTIPQEVVPGGINCQIDRWGDCPNLKAIRNESNVQLLEVENCDKLETLILGKHTKRCYVYGCKELADVYCAGMPNEASFSEDCQVEYATLHVPEMLIERYRDFSYGSSTSWKDFGNIVALKPGDPGYVVPDNTPITFTDAAFGAAAIANFDFDGDGKLSKYEASLVTDFGIAFKGNTNIKTLDDLQYFTSMLTINNSAFFGCSGITSVTIPSFITSIGKKAFYECSNMASVTIPKSVKFIGEGAFVGCRNLTAVHISDLTEWCKMPFDGGIGFEKCHLYLNGKEITDLVIPSSITHIKDYNFSGFTGLTSVTIPNSVTAIGSSTFYGCENLTSVTIPSSVTTIGRFAFGYCQNLKAVHITDVAAWCRIAFEVDDFRYCYSNPLKNSGAHLYLNGKEVTNLVIPTSVTSIGNIAFVGCRGLTSVTIPNSVKSIGYAAFSCMDIKEVRSMIVEPFAFDKSVFQYYYYGEKDLYTTATLYVPFGTKSKYEATDGWKNFTNIIETDFKDEPKGDLTGDELVNGTDMVALVNVIMNGGNNPSADVNGDGLVNGSDMVALVNIIMNTSNAREIMAARSADTPFGSTDVSSTTADVTIGTEPLLTNADGSRELTITLTNPQMDVTMVQMDVTMPEGLTLTIDDDTDMMAGRTTWFTHQLYTATTNNGRNVRLMLASGRNALIEGTEGGIIRLTLKADGDFHGGDIVLHDMLCTSPDLTEAWPADVVVHVGEATGITDNKRETINNNSVVYDLQGRQTGNGRFVNRKSTKGVNIINGRKVIK